MNVDIQVFILQVGFKPAVPFFERSKTMWLLSYVKVTAVNKRMGFKIYLIDVAPKCILFKNTFSSA
jgi:hypothetical protein